MNSAAADAEPPRITMDVAEALAVGAPVEPLHPAVAAVLRHRELSGQDTTASAVLGQLRSRISDHDGAQRVLAHWRGRGAELLAAADLASALLPQRDGAPWRFEGAIHFVLGYDIAVASPPDVVVNADHGNFRNNPPEVAHYVTHEAHHVGFLERRSMPSLEHLERREQQLRLIAFMTQMEGMAVHAAYGPRQRNNALNADEDYRIYTDSGFAALVLERYAQVRNQVLQGPEVVDGQTIGAVLTAMSSGERLWYRAGALAAWSMERRLGTEMLAASVDEPALFDAMVEIALVEE